MSKFAQFIDEFEAQNGDISDKFDIIYELWNEIEAAVNENKDAVIEFLNSLKQDRDIFLEVRGDLAIKGYELTPSELSQQVSLLISIVDFILN